MFSDPLRFAARTSRAALCLLLLAPLASGCESRTQAAGDLALAVVPEAENPSRVRVSLRGPVREALRRHLGAAPSPEKVERVLYLAVNTPGQQQAAAPVPVLARLEWSEDGAMLAPQSSLTPGLAYRAVFDGPAVSPSLPRLTTDYAVPLDRQPSAARVTGVYPSQAETPANLLKLYVHFSEPMAEGKVFQHVRLLDAHGKPISQAFREVELWADDHRRLTLWINPGRTKRSLGLSESLGPVLEAGRRYTLEVAAGLPDARGRPLAVGLRHPFRTGAMDRDQPRIQDWRIAAPAAGGRDALVVRFAEPLDHALLGRLLQVEDAAGRTLEGSASVSPEGTRWSFVPASPWAPGRLQLAAGGELEDLAGNSLYRPFETSAGEGRVPLSEPPAFKRSFVVRSR